MSAARFLPVLLACLASVSEASLADRAPSMPACTASGELTPICGGTFRVAEIDPDAWRATSLIEGAADVVGGASVALRVDDVIYVGAFSGDRIARARLNAVGHR